jgi:hypothetical protein
MAIARRLLRWLLATLVVSVAVEMEVDIEDHTFPFCRTALHWIGEEERRSAPRETKTAAQSTPAFATVVPAIPRYLCKVRRSASRKEIQNQLLTRTALKPRSAEVWRQTGREREFRASSGAS